MTMHLSVCRTVCWVAVPPILILCILLPFVLRCIGQVDVTNGEVVFSKADPLAALIGQEIQLEVVLTNSIVYTLGFGNSTSVETW